MLVLILALSISDINFNAMLRIEDSSRGYKSRVNHEEEASILNDCSDVGNDSLHLAQEIALGILSVEFEVYR